MSERRKRLRAALLEHGRETHAWAALEGGYETFEHDDGIVAFVRAGRSLVTVGAPLAPKEHHRSVAESFVEFARARRCRVCWFGVQEPDLLGPRFRALQVGAQALWEPNDYPAVLTENAGLREQLRRSRAKGVVVHVDEQPDPARLSRLAEHWLATRRMAPMGFVVALHPDSPIEGRRVFLAMRDAEIVAASFVVPIPGRHGVLIEDTLRTDETPNGTVELLHAEILRTMAEEGVRLVSAGIVPLAQITNPWLRRARALGRPLFSFEGLERFRAKLRPSRWEPVYIARPIETKAWISVVDALRAFASGSFLRFGWSTLMHRIDVVARVLAILLVPWIVILAVVPVATSFPSVAVRNAWIGLDVFLVFALFGLSVRWRSWLAVVLAIVAGLDAVLGAVQWWVFNRHYFSGAGHALLATASLLAPVFASAVLWCGRRGPSTTLFRAREALHDAAEARGVDRH